MNPCFALGRLNVPFCLIAFALGAMGCSSSTPDAKTPNAVNANARDTELTHEACALESSDAVPMDANGDGQPEIIRVMSGTREVCRAVDLNLDSIIDVFVYFDDGGQTLRRESGFDRDSLPDEIALYQAGVVVEKRRETNGDRLLDTWDFYEAGRMTRSERDSNADGLIDEWWTFDRPGRPECAVVVADEDSDGKPDPDSRVDTCEGEDPLPPPAAEPKPEPTTDDPGTDEPEVDEPGTGDPGEGADNDSDNDGPKAEEKVE